VNPTVRLSFEKLPFEGRSFQSPIYYGYRAGYYFTRHFGLEAEFIHLKVYADLSHPVRVEGAIGSAEVTEIAPMIRYADQFEVSHGLNMVLVNAVFRQTLVGPGDPADARIALIARIGAGPTIPRPEVIFLGVAAGAYEAGPIAFQAAAGLEARLWRGLRVLAEYKYTFTPTSFTIPDGRARFHVHSSHLVTGLAVYF
jgi:hypothetical protein